MEKSQIGFKAILRGEARMYRLRACRLFYRGIRFHRLVRCGESDVLDREKAFTPSRLLMDVHLIAAILARL